jgi:hypothetical protein
VECEIGGTVDWLIGMAPGRDMLPAAGQKCAQPDFFGSWLNTPHWVGIVYRLVAPLSARAVPAMLLIGSAPHSCVENIPLPPTHQSDIGRELSGRAIKPVELHWMQS